MTNSYRHVDSNGKVTYSDLLPSASEPTRAKSDEEARREHQEAVKYIKEAQKRIPKLLDYLEYAEYLRKHSPFKLEHVLLKLKDEDPQTYFKLQKYPQFRPLHNTALGLKAADKHIAAGIGFASGSITGSVEKWLETTVKDMMKRDRFGPYANVLRAETKPLNAKPPTYSNTRFGQYLKAEDARLAKTAEASAKAMDSARAADRTAWGGTISRLFGPFLDLGFGMLKRETAGATGNAVLRHKADKLHRIGVMNDNEWLEAQRLLSQGKYIEMQDFMKNATDKFVRGGP